MNSKENTPLNRIGFEKGKELDEKGCVIRQNREEAKREIAKIREIVEGLVLLPNDILERILNTDEVLFRGVVECKRLKGDAKVRQLQFITKQLNRIDFESFSVIYEKASYPYRQNPAKLREIDDLVEMLVDNQTEAIGKIYKKYVEPDIAHVRSLVRNFVKERAKIEIAYDDKGNPKKMKRTKSEKTLRTYLSGLEVHES